MAIDAKTISVYMQVTGPFAAQMGANAAATQSFGNSANAGMGKAQAGMARFAKTAKAVGLISAVGIAGGLALSAKAAIDFESSFAGVRKTVEASEETFSRLKMEIRGLALEIPIGVNELNRIAELGGQLGVDAGGLIDFTDTIAKVGVTTTLSTEAAATGFARLDNIMGTNQASFDKTGSSIVDLGNNFAATEDEILSFALRIAPIGATLGITTDEVLAIATAFTSVGIPAERGGTAIQKVLIAMSNAADLGGPKLQTFAETAGLLPEVFAKLVKEDPAKALQVFVNGLGGVIQSGGNASIILKGLSLNGERVAGSLLAMANADGVLDEALMRSEDAWNENNALQIEAEKRFETTKSQLILLKNTLVDTGISIGSELLPRINELITGLSAVWEWAVALPPVVQAVGGAMAGLAATTFLLTKHPVILGLTAVAALIAQIGANAQRSADQTEILNGALDKDRQNPELDDTGLEGLFNKDDLNKLKTLGFRTEDISDAIFSQNDEVFKKVSDSLKRAAFNELDAAAQAQVEADRVYAEFEGTVQDYFIQAGTFGRTGGLIKRIEDFRNEQIALVRERKRLSDEVQAGVSGLPNAEEREEHRQRAANLFGTEAEAVHKSTIKYTALTDDQLDDVSAALDDYVQSFSDAYDEIDDRIKGQIDLWYDWSDAVDINIADMTESFQRQATAFTNFENFFIGNDFAPDVEALIRKTFGQTPAAQEAFIELFRLDPELVYGEIAKWEQILSVQLTGLVDRVFNNNLPSINFLSGLDLLAALQEITDDVVAEAEKNGSPINPIDAWFAVLTEAKNQLPFEQLESIGILLENALANPAAAASLGLFNEEIQTLIDLLNDIPQNVTTTITLDVRGNIPEFATGNGNPLPSQPKTDYGKYGRAFGGSVMQGVSYRVGEHGPEDFVPFNSGTIIPNNKLNGGGTRNVEVNVIRPETNDLPGDIAEGLIRGGVTEQVDLIGAY